MIKKNITYFTKGIQLPPGPVLKQVDSKGHFFEAMKKKILLWHESKPIPK